MTSLAGGGLPVGQSGFLFFRLTRESKEEEEERERETRDMRGAFVVVEGLDRAGKSTQVARLAAALDCKPIKFPGENSALVVHTSQ